LFGLEIGLQIGLESAVTILSVSKSLREKANSKQRQQLYTKIWVAAQTNAAQNGGTKQGGAINTFARQIIPTGFGCKLVPVHRQTLRLSGPA
jgi:hypothetical protein